MITKDKQLLRLFEYEMLLKKISSELPNMDMNKVDITEEYVLRKYDEDPPTSENPKTPIEIVVLKYQAGNIEKTELKSLEEIEQFEKANR